MPEDKVTAHGRELGTELRRRRTKAGYNGKDMASRLGWSATKVSRAEVGARPITEADIIMYLASCGLSEAEIDPILALAREGTQDHRLKSHREKVPDALKTLIFHETTAAEIINFEPVCVPGLLQTEEYMRALFSACDIFPPDGVEFFVRARLARQALLRESEPPACVFFLHENSLCMPIGSARIMHEQLLHLIFLSSWRHCELRFIPRSTGIRGVAHGPFRLMRYVEHDQVVELEHDVVTLFLDRREHTDSYQRMLHRFDDAALDAGESRRILAELASEFDRAEACDRA